MKLFITALLLTVGLSPAMAQNQSALSLASLADRTAPAAVPAEVPAPEAINASAQAKGMPVRKDAFEGLPGCSVVDAMFFVQPTLSDAIKMLSGCLKEVEARYGFPVKAAVMAQGGERGINLIVPQKLPVGNRLLGDLRFSLEKRHDSLFGYPAEISAR